MLRTLISSAVRHSPLAAAPRQRVRVSPPLPQLSLPSNPSAHATASPTRAVGSYRFTTDTESRPSDGGPVEGPPFEAGMLGKVLDSWRALLTAVAGDSELARGGLTLAATGVAAASARLLGTALWEWSKRRCLVRLEMDSRDDAFRWMMYWLMQQPSFRRSNVLSVTTSLKSFGSSPVEESMLATGNSGCSIMLLPAPGDHVMQYRGAWVLISRQRAQGNPQLAANARLLMETLRLSTPAYSRVVLLDMLHEARAAYEASQMCRTSVFAVDQDGYWGKIGSRPVRPLSSVLLPPGEAEAVLADCRDFLGSEAWYAHRGIPYRRGYLLYGLPGTGKTSLVTALAGELGCHLYVVSLSSPRMTDEALGGLLTSSEEGSILLLEDVDAAFLKRDRVSGGEAAGGGLSFSGLLNAIDGVAAQEGRMLFMTTNHIERLSDALIRPGRVDVRLEFKCATEWQKLHLFTSFYTEDPSLHGSGTTSDVLAAQAELFCRRLAGVDVSMAALQGYLMRFKGDPEGAVQNCDMHFVRPPTTAQSPSSSS